MPPRTHPLSELLQGLPAAEVRGERGVAVLEIAYRSEDVVPGSLFFCVPGSHADGHDFGEDAARRGAVAILSDRWLELDRQVAQVRVPSVREAMGPVASAFFGRPSERLTLIGVTGTNGKTTTTYLLEGVLREAGFAPALVGTTGVRVGNDSLTQARTTPEAPDLQRLLADLLDRGVDAVAMEVSSHGLDQHRVGGMRFGCAVFTNLSQDHLDYHGDLDAYFRAKALLFDPAIADRAAVNIDSPYAGSLIRPDLPTLTFGTGPDADVRAERIEIRHDGLGFTTDGVAVEARLRGAFNVHNCLAAVAAARQVGIPVAVAARGVASVDGVPGRFEPVSIGQPFQVLVDYAHTPDGLENVLKAARPLASGRVVIVFGCGGDRDREKRPLMGEVATRLADLAIITSDNPRSEDPLAIIREIEAGTESGRKPFGIEPDRRRAIRLALEAARPGDVIVIAGKGHETGQEFADRVVPFDDRTVAAEELRGVLGATEGSSPDPGEPR